MTGNIKIKDLYSGWAYDPAGSNSKAVPGSPYQYSKSSGVALNRIGFNGKLAPGFVTDALTTSGTASVNATPLNAVVASNGRVFSVCRSARTVSFELGTEVIDVHYDVSHGGHSITTSDNADILIIKDKAATPKERVLISFEDGTDADIMLMNTDGTGQDGDWFSTRSGGAVLTKGVPLKMWTGPDGLHYCTNGQYLASIDILGDATSATAANCVVNAQALDIEPGWVFTSGCAFDLYSAAAAYKANFASTRGGRGEAKVFLWDGKSPSFNAGYDLNDYYVSALFNKNGKLFAITSGRNGSTKLQVFTGSSFEVVAQSSQIGSAPLHGSVDDWLGHLTWMNTSGIFSFGSANPDIPAGLHFPAAAPGDTVGMFKNLESNTAFVGASSGSNHYIRKTNPDKYGVNATLRTCVYSLPARSTITMFRIRFAQQGTGASCKLSLFKDFTTNAVAGPADLLNHDITPSQSLDVYYDVIRRTIPNINNFYLIITFNHASESNVASIIDEIEIEYEYEPINA